MTIIQVLPTEVVNLIAAGEVIDSLGAVVRELVENAIDAKATRIQLAVGSDLSVQVRDNGHGMSLADLEQAATPHTTSKIYTKLDLRQIHSLGFRGEALHSLAQLSDLHICSRVSPTDAGWEVTYDRFGHPLNSPKNVAIAVGTIVTARHIFHNHTARLQGLPSISQQLRKIQVLVSEIAIAHPQITWQATLDQKNWFTLWAGESAKDMLGQVVKSLKSEDLVQAIAEATTITMGLPDRTSRHRPDWARVAINGRFIQIPELEQTIMSSFNRTLPRHRYPVCVVHLAVNPRDIDWNRHPAKTEVYLHHLKDWQERISDLITKLLKTPEPTISTAVTKLLRTAETNANYTATPKLKVLAQVHNTYILAERESGLCLIEQHVAHERVLFENIENNWEIIALESPMVVKNLSELGVERLRSMGIEIEEFGVDVWAVRSLPKIIIEFFAGDRQEVLIELSLQTDISQAKATAACRSAIRNGTSLDLATTQDLVNKWEQTRNPHTCPHGRPICLSLESSDLARFFRRNWIVGN
jgi:DNA mismatch repair protein MutL